LAAKRSPVQPKSAASASMAAAIRTVRASFVGGRLVIAIIRKLELYGRAQALFWLPTAPLAPKLLIEIHHLP
jgi:hypothetical protein